MRLMTKRAPEPIQVSSHHIPFVAVQYERLEAAKADVKVRQDYLLAAGRVGVLTASLANVVTATAEAAIATRKAEASLDRIKRLLALGAEPTTPPQQWWCGHVEEPARTKDSWGDLHYPAESWPCASSQRAAMVFQSAIPIAALQRYAAAKPLLDEYRIYSPSRDDFLELANPEPRDPVLIGLITHLGESLFFEIARWDIDKDLAAIFATPR